MEMNDGFAFEKGKSAERFTSFEIDRVIFHDPATIVYWNDGTQTVVKPCVGYEFDPIMGLALCFMKKALGNKCGYNNVIHRWVED